MKRLLHAVPSPAAFFPSLSATAAWTHSACLLHASGMCRQAVLQPQPVNPSVFPTSSPFARWAHTANAKQAEEVLRPFLSSNKLSPPVSMVEGMPSPTALSWLRRRGPQGAPHGVLHKMFRRKQVRVFDGQRVKRVSARRLLSPGSVLLYPKELDGRPTLGDPTSHWAHQTLGTSLPRVHQDQGSTASRPDSLPTQASKAQQQQQQQQQQQWQNFVATDEQESRPAAAAFVRGRSVSTDVKSGSPAASSDPFIPRCPFSTKPLNPSMVRSWVLGFTQELVFINKPFGLMVQGYKNTLQAMMDPALKVHPRDEPPRLVHRLDRNVSGVMAVARSADAAAWLAACFRDKASQVMQRSLKLGSQKLLGDNRRRSILLQGNEGADKREVPEGMSVKRVYWAIVAATSLPQGKEGRMRVPVVVEGRRAAALTYYRVRRASEGLAWVELTPQTGRRHQLRVHCARVLKAPIVGDMRYGYKGVTPSKPLARALPPSFWTTFSPSTAEPVLHPPTRKERRQAAAAAARERLAANRSRLAVLDEEEEEEEGEMEEEEDTTQREELGSKHALQGNSDQLQPVPSSRSMSADGTQREGSTAEARDAADGSQPRLSRADRVAQLERELPLLLHSRAMVIKRQGKHKVLRVQAPLPLYMAAIFDALGWPVPKD